MILELAFFWQSHLERAQALLREQKLEEAAQAISQALADQPASVPALLLQGRLAIARNDPATARAAFTRAVALAPESAGAQFLLGFFHYIENDFRLARPALEHARKLNPKDARAALFLALTYDGLAMPVEAETEFRETLRLERPSVETHIAFSRMLFTQGRFDDAQQQVTRALALDPKSRDALYEQARLAFERGNDQTAISAASEALKGESEGVSDRQVHFLLSRAYARAGNAELARKHRERFEAIPPRMVR